MGGEQAQPETLAEYHRILSIYTRRIDTHQVNTFITKL